MQHRYHGTDIDGLTLDPEQLCVQQKNLNELIGRFSFSEALFHLLTGNEATVEQATLLDSYLAQALSSLAQEDVTLQVIPAVVSSGASISQAIITGLMVDRKRAFERLQSRHLMEPLELAVAAQLGVYYIGLIPGLMAIAVKSLEIRQRGGGNGSAAVAHGHPPAFATFLSVSCQEQAGFLECVFKLCTGRGFDSPVEAKLFHDVMVSFHAGFGFATPTVMLPRIAASTQNSIAQAIAAGFTAAGPAHVGACDNVMALFSEIYQRNSQACSSQDWSDAVIRVLEDRLARKEKIPGFGHPIFKIDPRPSHLRAILTELQVTSAFVDIYDVAVGYLHRRFGIHPNIDSISATIFLTLGIGPQYGTALFLCSRSCAMVAHALEQSQRPPFGATSTEIRKWLGPLVGSVE